jgi:hypothetical protein
VRAARTDNNHREIVEALRDAGASVFSLAAVGLGFPDLGVGFAGRNYFIEVKGPKGELNAYQKALHGMWKGQMAVVRTPEEALAVIGMKVQK